MGTFLLGLLTGTVAASLITTMLVLKRSTRDDAVDLADRLEQDEKLERDFSG